MTQYLQQYMLYLAFTKVDGLQKTTIKQHISNTASISMDMYKTGEAAV